MVRNEWGDWDEAEVAREVAPWPKKRGFAALSPEKRREISSKGGKFAHASGKAHQFTHDEAVEAGRKGGIASQAKQRANSNSENKE